jgi:hypothetical protein
LEKVSKSSCALQIHKCPSPLVQTTLSYGNFLHHAIYIRLQK